MRATPLYSPGRYPPSGFPRFGGGTLKDIADATARTWRVDWHHAPAKNKKRHQRVATGAASRAMRRSLERGYRLRVCRRRRRHNEHLRRSTACPKAWSSSRAHSQTTSATARDITNAERPQVRPSARPRVMCDSWRAPRKPDRESLQKQLPRRSESARIQQ